MRKRGLQAILGEIDRLEKSVTLPDQVLCIRLDDGEDEDEAIARYYDKHSLSPDVIVPLIVFVQRFADARPSQ
jgi:hypothetical protein